MAVQYTYLTFTPSSHAIVWTGEPLTAGVTSTFYLLNSETPTNDPTAAATLTLVVKAWGEPTVAPFLAKAGWTSLGGGAYSLAIDTRVAAWLLYMNSAITRKVEVEIWDLATGVGKLLGYDSAADCYRAAYRTGDVAAT